MIVLDDIEPGYFVYKHRNKAAYNDFYIGTKHCLKVYGSKMTYLHAS